NEVNSRNPSQLNGVLEVAGQKAQVIIANPSGITCNGCGFINASRSTLTTGKPIIQNGDLTGYRVEQGKITITGKGLNSSEQSYTDLISHTVSVNSAIWANKLNVVTGKNKVSQDSQTVEPLDDTNPSERPEVSIDVSQFGGMYAGSIRMVGTEKGVGVHNAGELGASINNISISADGKITNRGAIQANKNVILNSQHSVDNHKQLYAKKDIQVNAKNSVKNTGSFVAQKNIAMSANRIENSQTGTLAAGVDSHGKLSQDGSLDINATTAHLTGKSLASASINVQASGDVNLDNSQQIANAINISGKELSAKQSVIKADQNIKLTAQDNLTATDSHIFSNENIAIKAGKTINGDDISLMAKRNIHAQGQQISLQKAQTLSEKDSTFIANKTINNREAKISSKGNVSLDADDINNSGATFISEQTISLSANNKLINQQAKFNSHQHISFSANEIDNQQVIVQSLGETQINAKTIDNRQAKFNVDQLDIKAQQLLNQKANMLIQKAAAFAIGNMENQDAKILAYDLAIDADKLSGDGQLLAENDIRLTLVDSLHNQSDIIANNNIYIQTQQDILNDQLILSGKKLDIISQQLTNSEKGEISSDLLNLTHDT
ncbi:filamentous hemagglutinin N-terminal domain-containing protein, partial [Gilliamella apicola]